MKKIILFVLLITLIGLISIFSFREYVKNRCEEIDFANILNNEYAYVDDNGKVTNLTVVFSNDGRIFGFSGVNKYFAGYKLSDNQITISTIGTTMNTTFEEEMNSEKKYIETLNNVSTARACKNKLLLKNNDKTLKFVPTGKEVTEIISDVNNSNVNPTDTNETATNDSSTTEQPVEENTNTSVVEDNNVPTNTENAPVVENNN